MKLLNMNFWLAAVAGIAISGSAFGFGEPKNSKVAIETKTTPEGTAFDFKVVPNENLVITLDAPWKFVVSEVKGATFSETTLKKEQLDQDMTGYRIVSTKNEESGSFKYKLTSFVCTKDKTSCYREVHKGEHSW
jgi:hypothetical protein